MEVRSCGADVWWASHDGAQLRSAKDLLLAVASATAALRFYLRSCTCAPPCSSVSARFVAVAALPPAHAGRGSTMRWG